MNVKKQTTIDQKYMKSLEITAPLNAEFGESQMQFEKEEYQ